MIVYLIRHGIATERGKAGLSDADRPLTSEGIRRTRLSARGLQRLGVKVDAVWSSPLLRAHQTADLVVHALGFTSAIQEEPALEPEADVSKTVALLREASADARIALVGHEPHLGKLAGTLLTGTTRSILEFKKGGAAAIEIERPRKPLRGCLLWLLTPRQLRRIRSAD